MYLRVSDKKAIRAVPKQTIVSSTTTITCKKP